MKNFLIALLLVTVIAGCATITEDAMDPIVFSFSDGSVGTCHLSNKRGDWDAEVPGTTPVRKSDDVLKYDCKTADGRESVGSFESTIGAKIVASAVFIDFGITDAITDKHRDYPANFVLPVKPREGGAPAPAEQPAENDVYTQLEKLNDLRERGIITQDEFDAEKKQLLESN